MKKLLAVLTALLLLAACLPGLAESVTVNGTVVATESTVVTAPIGGTVKSLLTRVGARVDAGDALADLKTTVVYAEENGVVRTFGRAGDNTETVAARFGAVAYVEPSYSHTIAATTRQAFDAEENRIIHPGEKVYLRSYSDAKNVGRGTVTQVSGTSFTVEITEGAFSTGELVNVFRKSNYETTSRLGRGSVAHTDPKAYTGEGSIVSFLVTNGQDVKRGDPLFETLSGQFDALNMTGSAITSSVAGIVASISVTPGAAVEKGAAAVEIYPDSAMRIEASVSETNLRSLAPGSKVSVEFPYLQENTVVVEGTVERISFLADGTNPDASEEESSSDEAYYLAYIAFEPVENVRYGMTAVITSEPETAAAEEAEAPAEEAAEAPEPEEEAPADGQQP